jgi:acyl-CoA hydrolase
MSPRELPAKTVACSAVREQVYMVFPNDLNANGTVFGGLIMAQMDRFAAVAADRHAGGICVTASVDAVHFVAPAKGGDVLIFNCSVNRAWTTSMEVGCKVEAERMDGTRRHILSAYLTFVAVDADGRPGAARHARSSAPRRGAAAVRAAASPPRSDASRPRFPAAAAAKLRRELRLRHAEELKTLRAGRHPV